MLDSAQIQLIESDVESARITLYNLSDELVDHICCAIEDQMRNGKNFDEAYALLKEQTGIKVLQNIQENTLYLTDKKYRLMKTTMKITGNVSLALLALGTLFKIFHWPGASPLLVVGFALLCFFFFPAVVYINHRDGNSPRRPFLNGSILIGGVCLMAGILFKVMHWPFWNLLMLGGWFLVLFVFLPILLYIRLKDAKSGFEKRVYVLGVVALIIFELATMFKMMHWPGAGPLMILGSLLLVAVFLPLYTNMRFKNAELKTGQFIYLITISMYAVVLTALLSMNVSRDILGSFVREQNNTTAIVRYFEKKNDRTKANISNLPDSIQMINAEKIKQISEEADKVKNEIRSIKLYLVQEIEEVDKATALAAISEPTKINRKDEQSLTTAIMVDQFRHIYNMFDAFPAKTGLASPLKNEVDGFREKMLLLASSNPELSKNISKLLDTGSKIEYESEVSWEVYYFTNNPLISTLGILTTLEKNVSIVESATIQHLNP